MSRRRVLPALLPLLRADASPEVVGPGVISTAAEEYRITFTPDGYTAWFARGETFFPFSRRATIYRTQWEGGAWQAPVPATFSGSHPDIDPAVSHDGSRLFFSSIRLAGDDAELFVMQRGRGGWGSPRHLSVLGSPGDELYPSPAPDGTLYFGSDRDGGNWDIWLANPRGSAFDVPVKVGPSINTESFWEFNPVIAPNGEWLVFTGLNWPNGSGFGDLYASRNVHGVWQTPVPLTVNTAADEFHASFDPSGTWLYFVRRPATEDAHGDLLRVRWREALGP